jgi:hypothetical protein
MICSSAGRSTVSVILKLFIRAIDLFQVSMLDWAADPKSKPQPTPRVPVFIYDCSFIYICLNMYVRLYALLSVAFAAARRSSGCR